MPMEHLNERGELCQGYYCATCGQPVAMYGHFNTDCKRNTKLVKKLDAINEAGSIEAYTFNLLKSKEK